MLDRLDDPGIFPAFFVYIEDTGPAWAGHYFTSHRLPDIADDDQTVCMDPQQILQEDGTRERKAGVISPRTMRLTLGPTNSERLTYMLAPTQNGETGVYVEGRLAYVFMGLADASGRMLDAVTSTPAAIADNQAMIWAGPVESCAPSQNWYTWALNIQSLEALLDTEIGGEKLTAYLTPTQEGIVVPAFFGVEPAAGQRTVHWTFYHYHTGAATDHVDLDYTFAADTVVTIHDIGRVIIDTTNTWIGGEAFSSALLLANIQQYNWDETAGEKLEADELRLSFSIYIDYGSGGTALNPTQSPEILIDPTRQGSVLPYFGFVAKQLQYMTTIVSSVGTWTADQAPAIVYLGKDQFEITLWGLSDTPPDAGFFRLKLPNGAVEFVKYGDLYQASGTTWVFDCSAAVGGQRGALSTFAQTLLIPLGAVRDDEGNWVMSQISAVEVLFCAGVENMGLGELIRVLATGSDAASPVYDPSYAPGLPGILPDDIFDEDTFSALSTGAALPESMALRTYAWAEKFNLRDWISQELAAAGYTLGARWNRNTREFKLHLDRLTTPTVYSLFPTVTYADLLHDQPTDIEQTRAGVINAVSASCLSNELQSDSTVDFTMRWTDSITRLKCTLAEKYKVRGIDADKLISAVDSLSSHFWGLLASYAYPYQIIHLPLRRWWWRLQPGDMISLSHPGIPGLEGGRGWLNEPLRVLGLKRAFLPNVGEPVCIATCLRGAIGRLSFYSPSAEVDSWNAGNNTMTLVANVFSNPDVSYPLSETGYCDDVKWFENAASVRICDHTDDDQVEDCPVDTVVVAARTIKLTGAPARAPVAGDWITMPTWADRSTYDKIFGALADNGTDLLNAVDPAFKYA